jgi:hypothetical protein
LNLALLPMARPEFNEITVSQSSAASLRSRPRMRGVIGLFQPLRREMRVHLRRHEMGVAQQFLHAAQIRAGIEQMRGVTVPSSKKKNNSEQDRLPNPISAKLPAVNF